MSQGNDQADELAEAVQDVTILSGTSQTPDVSEANGFDAGPIEASAFKEAMSAVAGAVHIIATDGPAGRAGLTATAVSSVSDKPPTLLVCLNRSSRTAEILLENGRFSVNTLNAGQEAVARIFAQPMATTAERFAAGTWQFAPEAPPRLADTLAWFSLEISEAREIGSHLVLFGIVRQAEAGQGNGQQGEPLLYHRRGYRKLIPSA